MIKLDHPCAHLKNAIYCYPYFIDVKIEAVSDILRDTLSGDIRAGTNTEAPRFPDCHHIVP